VTLICGLACQVLADQQGNVCYVRALDELGYLNMLGNQLDNAELIFTQVQETCESTTLTAVISSGTQAASGGAWKQSDWFVKPAGVVAAGGESRDADETELDSSVPWNFVHSPQDIEAYTKLGSIASLHLVRVIMRQGGRKQVSAQTTPSASMDEADLPRRSDVSGNWKCLQPFMFYSLIADSYY
jgi:hypothetical protein